MSSSSVSNGGQAPPPPPPSSSVLFARGVIARLAIWSTLRIAVQESWGGANASQKRTWLASVLVDTFEETNPPPDDQYIEELLLQVMSDEFEVAVEDGSAESVAKDLVKLWEDTRQGRAEGVEKFEKMAEGVKSKKLDVVQKIESDEEGWEDDDSEDGDESSEEDAEVDNGEVPQLLSHVVEGRVREEPEVDEDGFTVVKSKSKTRR